MASTTPNIGLYKKDPVADANDYFNIQTMLNNNWDALDSNQGSLAAIRTALGLTSSATIADILAALNTKLGGGSWYGTCGTAASTQEKVVACSGFVLATGVSIRVKFSNAQSYDGVPKLNVNSTGAIEVRRNVQSNQTQALPGKYEWRIGEVVDFVYDGTYWVITDGAIANTDYYGVTKLSSATDDTSEVLAATPKAVKTVMDAIPAASSTTPKMDGTAAVGTGTTWAKADHIHPSDTTRQAKITASGILKGDGNGGVSAAVAGTDYAPAYSYSTTDLTAGTSTLATGKLYFVYE